MSFSNAITKNAARPSPKLVCLDEYLRVNPCDEVSREKHENVSQDERRENTIAVVQSRVPDMLDSSFIEFHANLKSHMLDKYGLMGGSEAYLLHAAISPCVEVEVRSPEEAFA